ncbi:MAG: competence/damage-inducible protein A [Promethearchaeota archaeon]
MNVELLIIGNEILIGKTQDTNSNWMAKRITKHGHHVRRITTIGDDLDDISSTLRNILERQPDVLIISGGLGPTFDDMTLKGVAKALNRELILNLEARKSIEKAYENAYKQGILKLQGMTPEREKMAYLPRGSIPLKNIRGTAPGVKLKVGKTHIFCLPGVPMEMKAMFKNSILPMLKEKKEQFIQKGFIFMGIGESQIAPHVTRLEKEYPQLWIKTHPRVGLSVEVELSITCFNVENGEQLVDEVIEKMKKIVLELNGKLKEY